MNHTVFFLGMCFLQVIFVTYQYILFRRKEFLYYLFYTFCVTIFISFKAFSEYNPLQLLVIKEENFTAARSVLLIGYAMYYRFGRHFTETNILYPKLNRQLLFAERIFISFGLIDIILLLNGVDFYVLEPVSQAIYLMAMPFSIYAIIFLITRKRELTSIYVLGSGLLLFFASAGFIDRIFISERSRSEHYYLAYVELGIFFEFLFLNYGLIYKTRMLQKQNMQLEVEKQVELYKQRQRISNDLHDEVGATLSGLAMYSQLTRDQMQRNDTEKMKDSLNVMEQSASQMVDKLSDIVWAVNPQHDSLVQLLRKLEDYATEICGTKEITVHMELGKEVSDVHLSMEARRSIYLLCKEAVNNAVKYSNCTEIKISVNATTDRICFQVQDNGCGFDEAMVRKGNGLNNMKHRATDLQAQLVISSKSGTGTNIRLEHILPQ